MTILIDSRVGSKDLIKPLGSISSLTTLEFADAMFIGAGPNAKPIFVGIEIKTVKDALSCVMSGRFAGHQLPGLVKEYDVIYLIIEGLWKSDREGLLEVRYGKGWRAVNLGHRYFMWRDFSLWLTSMESMGGLRLRFTRNRSDTVAVIKTLYKWWTAKDWEEHRSHLVANKSGGVLGVKYSLRRRFATLFKGIDDKRSAVVAEHFKRDSASESIEAMLDAGVKDWMSIDGIGEKTAESIRRELT